MTGEWIDAVVLVEATHARRLQRVVEGSVSGLDATYRLVECLGVELPTEEDEALFRLCFLGEDSMGDIHRVERLSYAVSARLSDDVRRFIARGAFDGATRPLTAALLELRGGSALDRLEAGLQAERPSFGGQTPAVYLC
jgi:hypothetical protein